MFSRLRDEGKLSQKKSPASSPRSAKNSLNSNPLAGPFPYSIPELEKLDHRLYNIAQDSDDWLSIREALLREQYITRTDLKNCGGVVALKTRFEKLVEAFGIQIDADTGSEDDLTVENTLASAHGEDDIRLNRAFSPGEHV